MFMKFSFEALMAEWLWPLSTVASGLILCSWEISLFSSLYLSVKWVLGMLSSSSSYLSPMSQSMKVGHMKRRSSDHVPTFMILYGWYKLLQGLGCPVFDVVNSNQYFFSWYIFLLPLVVPRKIVFVKLHVW